jgi:hypothetical protein
MTFLRLAFLAVLVLGCVRAQGPMSNQHQQDPWVIRTDFSDDEEWTLVRDLIAAPQTAVGQKFYAYVRYISDEKYAGMACLELVHSLPDDYPGFFCFVVDSKTLTDEGHPVLVVGFSPKSGEMEDYQRSPKETPSTDIQTFRAIPSEIQSIQNNLSIANMDFEEFANSVDDDGVFRGFPR